mmetsp:Transcript_20514/g.56626  ORF Transcript_20514/g.56626 Transcript_20514/m.56626 type:complete len:485 (-) Transcript_20514:58-1512(-)
MRLLLLLGLPALSRISASVAFLVPARRQVRTSLRQEQEHDKHDEGHEAPNDTVTATRVTTSRRQWLKSTLVAATVATTTAGIHQSAAIAATTTTVVTPVVTRGAVCDASVTVWQRNGGGALLYLLGTAHISEQSADLAGQLVEQTHPNAVMVELDLKRLGGGGSATSSSSNNKSKSSSSDVGPALAAPPDISPTRVILTPASFSTDDGDDDEADNANRKQSRIVIPRVNNIPTLNASVETPSSSSLLASSSTSSEVSPATTTATTSMSKTNIDKPPGLFSGFRQGLLNAGAAAVGGAIRGMYKNLGQAGFQPGQEFVNAMAAGQAQGADVILGDRDVQVTLRRLTEALAVTDLDKLLNPDSELEQSMKELFGDAAAEPANPLLINPSENPQQFKQEMTTYVETLKSRDRIQKIMAQLKAVAPELVQVMLTERDAYMATGLDVLSPEYPIITAVFGMAHQDGIEQNLRRKGWQQVTIPCQKAAVL